MAVFNHLQVRFLRRLYEAVQGDEAADVACDSIADEMGITRHQAKLIARYLISHKLLRPAGTGDGDRLSLTGRGVEFVEETISEPEDVRNRILEVISDHERSKSEAIITTSEIADKVTGSLEDIGYHLEILERQEYVHLTHSKGGDPNRGAGLTTLGKQRAREGHFLLLDLVPRLTIGAVVHSMTGGTVQAVGVATNAEISQVVNDPEMLRASLADLGHQLVDNVKAELPAKDLGKYLKAVEALTAELQRPRPDPSAVKRLLGTLAFMGDVEGTFGLMARVWPYVSPLVVVADRVLASLPR